VFQRVDEQKHEYKLVESNLKGHSRMILDAAWAPGERRVFATAGRDKSVKIWVRDREAGFTCKATIAEEHPVTAVDFLDVVLGDGKAYLAVGTEVGGLRFYSVDVKGDFSATEVEMSYASTYPYPSKTITQLAWKPSRGEGNAVKVELAIASEDSSLRIYSLNPPSTS